MKKRILIVGLFSDTSRFPITQAGELAKLLSANGYKVLTTSRFRNRMLRLLDIIFCLVSNKNKFDVGIVQFYSGNSLIWQYIACRLIKWFGKKLIITVHGGRVPQRIKLYPNRYLPLLRKADMITCPSEYIINELAAYGISAGLIENSIPVERYPFVTKTSIRPELLWMRGLAEIYNPAMAVNVIKELKKDYPDVKLYIGGNDMGLKTEIEGLINSHDLQDNVEIVGFLNHTRKIEYAAKADIFISTSKIDNAPVCVTEMWAMGLPVVSTNVGGIPFLIEDNKTGKLVDSNDVLAMTDAIRELINSNELVQRLVANGRTKALMYSENNVAAKWELAINRP